MKINWGFGPPKHDAADGSAPARDKASAGDKAADTEQHTWTAGSSMVTRAVVGLLWVALVAGPLALALQVLFPEPAPIVRQDGYVDRLGEATAVSEFAERAVVAWLETPAQESDVLDDYFGDLDQSRPDVPWTTARSSVAEIVKDDSGLWSVVVGVDATEGEAEADAQSTDDAAAQDPPAEDAPEGDEAQAEPEDDAGDDAEPVERVTSGRLYFQIPVLYAEGQMIAQALPAPVPAPAEFDQLASAYDHELAANHPAFARVTNFLNAMLVTGDQAELEAYSNPGTSFRALNPVPYAAVEVNSIVATGGDAPSEQPDDGERAEVQANVTLSGSNEEQLGAQYSLVLLARQGRWEVAELRTSPALAEPVPLPTPTPDTTQTPRPNPSSGGPSDEPTREAGSDPAHSGSTTESP